ncbi:MAG: hypothetical protein LBQ86_08030 [Holophagales bacterium]|jgi:hypothetical protein|nr:hypothetical protein [Holophagales bacterium]
MSKEGMRLVPTNRFVSRRVNKKGRAEVNAAWDKDSGDVQVVQVQREHSKNTEKARGGVEKRVQTSSEKPPM